jgi:hypothetical protein
LKKIVLLTIGLIYFYTPWIWIFIQNQFWPMYPWQPFSTQFQSRWTTGNDWISGFTNGMIESSVPHIFQSIFYISIIILIDMSILYSLIKHTNSKIYQAILIFTGLSLNIFLFSPLHVLFDLPKYSMYIFPMVILSFCIFLSHITSKKIYFLIYAFLCIFSFLSIRTYPFNKETEHWEKISSYISNNQKNNESILFSPCYLGLAFNYYSHSMKQAFCFEKIDMQMRLYIWRPNNEESIYLITYLHDTASQKLFEEKYNTQQTYIPISYVFGNIQVLHYKKSPTTLHSDDTEELQQYAER